MKGYASRAALCGLLALCGTAGARAEGCPTEDQVRAAIEHYITADYWSPAERDTWKVTAVDGFTFSPVRYGTLEQRYVDFAQPREVCPVRVVWSFRVTKADGRVEETAMGEGKTVLFYQDSFGDWTFKIS